MTDAKNVEFNIVKMNGMYLGFTEDILDRTTVPDGLLAYGVMEKSKRVFLQDFVAKNQSGTVLTKDGIQMDLDGTHEVKEYSMVLTAGICRIGELEKGLKRNFRFIRN